MIAVFDTAAASNNLGDQMIMEATLPVIREIAPCESRFHVPTHEHMALVDRGAVLLCRKKFVCGTNLLNGDISKYRQWKLRGFDPIFVRNSILLGCGWWKYEERITPWTRRHWRLALSRCGLHSVRDEYTRQRLAKMGIENVVVTGCPTLWSLDEEHCSRIPTRKASQCVVTLTDYNKDRSADSRLLRTCLGQYEKVYFWPQGSGDLDYFRSLGIPVSEVVLGGLPGFDRLLGSTDVEYVGTRLHGGIRAMQFERRSLIIAIDNRATEMAKLVGMPILQRGAIEDLEARINSQWETHIRLPSAAIESWMAQFL